MILIEHPEAGARELGRVAVRKELLVDAQEAGLGELPIWAVLPEALVPLFDFPLRDCSRDVIVVVVVCLFGAPI